jgi:hypothetical protein
MVANAAKLTALPIVTVVDFGFTRAPPDVVGGTLFFSSLLRTPALLLVGARAVCS